MTDDTTASPTEVVTQEAARSWRPAPTRSTGHSSSGTHTAPSGSTRRTTFATVPSVTDNGRSYQDDLNTAALSELLGVPPFVAEEIDEDDDE